MRWVYDPHSGGVEIPRPMQERIRRRILTLVTRSVSEGTRYGKSPRLRVGLLYPTTSRQSGVVQFGCSLPAMVRPSRLH